jgi:hypothetical protein
MSTSVVLKSREEWVAMACGGWEEFVSMACGIGEEKEAAMATGLGLGGETGAREQRIGRETGEETQGCLHHFHAPLFFALELFICLCCGVEGVPINYLLGAILALPIRSIHQLRAPVLTYLPLVR